MNGKKMVAMMALALALAGAAVVSVADPAAAHTCTSGNECNPSSCPNDGRIHKHQATGCDSLPTLMIV